MALSSHHQTPADLFGPLLARVQESALLADGKTFVDAVPSRPPTAIMRDFAAVREGDDAALFAFVNANFALPASAERALAGPPGVSLRDYIRGMWPTLARLPAEGVTGSSALAVRHPHVVPGGRFREIYYWDSYFTLLGLVRDGHRDLAQGMVNAMTDLIEEHGYVPNGTRTYYLGRSQPPLYFMMVAVLDGDRPNPRRLAAMKREHAWWMTGASALANGAAERRVARLSDGTQVNRYWDERQSPRDESWREDRAAASASGRPAEQVFRDLRAGAESGWDFSSRWLDGPSLSTIRTTSIAPVDLNAFLFGLESALARAGDADAPAYAKLAGERQAALQQHFWDASRGYFSDLDIDGEMHRPQITAATLAPLLVGAATQDQADAVAQGVRRHLLAPGGLRTTLVESGEQWDRPNGWAPLQWIAVAGLRRYGHLALAREIAQRWVATVDRTYRLRGLIYEKYDVEAGDLGAGGEYAPQTGFGWTNGVTAEFLDMED